jgi:hypothetical protein
MHPSDDMERIVEKVRYRVRGGELLAHDEYWDGNNFERHGRNTFLYRAPGGHYFAVHLTRWQGEENWIEPLPDEDEAYRLYESLRQKEVPVELAFPTVSIVEA